MKPEHESDALLVLCTCPDEDTAERLAHSLVEDRLAACVNLIPGLVSVYQWQGRIERSREVQLLAKTSSARFQALAARLREMHPFELPEIVAVPITAGEPEYLEWLRRSTRLDS